MYRKNEIEKRQVLVRDIKRAVLLSTYMQHWGMPESRTISSKGNEKIEIYSFPPMNKSSLHRFATIGVSEAKQADGMSAYYDFMMVLPRLLGDSSEEEVVSFMMDAVAYSLNQRESLQEGMTIPETSLAPKNWKPKALLIDTPRAESEELSEYHIGGKIITLYWLVPIHKDEYELILNQGIDSFDYLCEQSELSLAEINRKSFVEKG